MKITGPFLDTAKKGQPKPWFLRLTIPVVLPDGTYSLNSKGRMVMKRQRPYYPTKSAATADIPHLKDKHNATGSGSTGILNRAQVADFESAKKIVPEASLSDVARFWRMHHPLTASMRIGTHVARVIDRMEQRRGRTKQWKGTVSKL
jgi:hypothetical protein